MPTLQTSRGGFAQGDNVSITVTVTSVPPGDTLAKAWMTVKVALADADPGLYQKVILPSAVAGQGQILDTGSSGTGILRFDLQQADTALMSPGVQYFYDIQAKTAGGLIGTLELGAITCTAQVTKAVA